MSNFTINLYFQEEYPEDKLKQLQQLINSKGELYSFKGKNKGKNVCLNVNSSQNSKDICSEVIKLFKSFKDSDEYIRQCLYQCQLDVHYQGEDRNFLMLIPVKIYDIMQQVTDVSFEFHNTDFSSKNIDDLTNIFKLFRHLEYFTIKCNEQICFKNNTQLDLFCTSLSPLITNLKSFQILNNLKGKKKGYTIPIPSNFTSQISKLLSNCKMLKTLKLDFAYMGWDRQRSSYIPQNFLTNLLMYCDQCPGTLQVLEINFDRMTYENAMIDFNQVQSFLTKLTSLIKKQADLNEFSFDLSGFKPSVNRDISQQFIQLSKELKNVRKLNLELGGYFQLQSQDWQIFLKNISEINNLEKLSLNIEFWKNFYHNPCQNFYHASIIQQFVNDLIKNHKFRLQSLSLNTDDWFFLTKVDHQKIINLISEFLNLKSLTLLFEKSSKLNYYQIQQFEYQVKQRNFHENIQPTSVQLPQINSTKISNQIQSEVSQIQVAQKEINNQQSSLNEEEKKKKSTSKKMIKSETERQQLDQLLQKYSPNQKQNEQSQNIEYLKKKYLSSPTQ
ncbi:hypothetical protein ABPG72_000566 [Tetrahymena utriculariae]